MKIHYLQHVPFEGLGSIEAWAARNNHTVGVTRLYKGETAPALDSFHFLVVMGGPMNIYEHERHPWLVSEKDFIGRAIESDKPVLGVCLGAQLIADVLGAKVHAGAHKEIGWFPITLTPEAEEQGLAGVFGKTLTVMHWHGDTFTIPEGAVRLAQSEACPNQGFVWQERVMGLQFHLETTRESLRALIENSMDELVEAPYIQTPDEMLAQDRPFARINQVMDRVLDYLAERVAS